MGDMDKFVERYKQYQNILKSKGAQRGKLTDVLGQAMHHNFPNSFELAIRTGLLTGGIETAMGYVSERVGLVNRHIIRAQGALEEIYELAKKGNHTDIISVFERDYDIGHSGKTD